MLSTYMDCFVLHAFNFHLRVALKYVYQMTIEKVLLINKHVSSLNG